MLSPATRTTALAAARGKVTAAVVIALFLAACTSATNGSGRALPASSSSITTPTPSSTAASAAVSSPPSTVTVTAAPPAPPSFSELYQREKSGVVRIEVVGCSDAGIGTGFLVQGGLVATVAHVVARSVVVSLVTGHRRTTGTVIGLDAADDLALVRPAEPIRGHVFTLADQPPRVGDPVAAIGFPIGDPMTYTQGSISGLHRRILLNGAVHTGLVETDTALNPGNSGGPLLAASGQVVGLVDAGRENANGISYAVPSTQAAARVAAWQHSPRPVSPARCRNPLGPTQTGVDVPTPHQVSAAAAHGVAAAFDTYFGGINSGDYAAAYAVLSPQRQAAGSYAHFAAGDATSFDSDIHVLTASQPSPDVVMIGLQFTSLQRPDHAPNGRDSCDVWRLTYRMIRNPDNSWSIDATTAYEPSGDLYRSC